MLNGLERVWQEIATGGVKGHEIPWPLVHLYLCPSASRASSASHKGRHWWRPSRARAVLRSTRQGCADHRRETAHLNRNVRISDASASAGLPEPTPHSRASPSPRCFDAASQPNPSCCRGSRRRPQPDPARLRTAKQPRHSPRESSPGRGGPAGVSPSLCPSAFLGRNWACPSSSTTKADPSRSP